MTAKETIIAALALTNGSRDPKCKPARIETGRRRLSSKALRTAAKDLGVDLEYYCRRQTRYSGHICEWLVFTN